MNQNTATIEAFTHSFYAVKGADNKYFAGFNPAENKASLVDSPETAKWFSNRFEIRLRPNEMLVEIKVDPKKGVVSISEPFRPRKRTVNEGTKTGGPATGVKVK